MLTNLRSENLTARKKEDGTCTFTLSTACRDEILGRVTANALTVAGNATAQNCQLVFTGKDGSEADVMLILGIQKRVIRGIRLVMRFIGRGISRRMMRLLGGGGGGLPVLVVGYFGC